MLRPATALVPLLALCSGGCEACDEIEAAPPQSTAADTNCDAPAYGHPLLESLYAVEAEAGVPAILSANTEAVIAVADPLLAALERALTVDRDDVPELAAVVVLGDVWGAAARLQSKRVSTARIDALSDALEGLIALLAIDAAQRPNDQMPPPGASSVLPEADGWRELDTEHPSLMHERAFGLRRVFRIFVRGDHDARALVSQLVALDATGRAYLSPVVGEVELLELDAEGPTAARVLHLDRSRLGCGEATLHEESEVSRIPGIGADYFLLDLPAPEPLATLPCSRCHEDADAFSLPTEQTSVTDRLTRLLSRIEEQRRSIPLVPGTPPSAQ